VTSIYKRPRFLQPESIDARIDTPGQPGGEVVDTDSGPEPAGLSTDDFEARRKAEPANVLLPVARAWLASLPDSVRPMALAWHYPRLANRFATAWTDKASVALVFDDLLADRRGTRRGFAPAVEANLLALWRYWNY
jgi:hypothetical protein